MLPSRYRTTFLSVLLFTLIISYLPMPVSSFPIIVFRDRISHASNSSYNDDQLVFDVSFTFVLFIAVLMTYVWIVCRMTIDRFISWVNRLFAFSIAVAERVVDEVEQVVDQLFYFRFDTVFRIGPSILVDANDFRRDFARPTGEPANPIPSTPRHAPQSQPSPRVIPPGYGISRVDMSDRGPPPQSQRPPLVIPPGYGIRRIDRGDRRPPPLRSTPPA